MSVNAGKSDHLHLINIHHYLHQGGNDSLFVCLSVCLSVCLCVSKITQKVMNRFFWNFEGMSGVAQTTSDSILEVIRQESWILDHFEILVTIALKGA